MFTFRPAGFIPFRDTEVLNRVRTLTGEDYLRHDTLKIQVLPDHLMGPRFVADMVGEIVRARDEGRRCVIVTPNPNPAYREVAIMLNAMHVDCKHVVTFNMDEWANEDDEIADESYPQSFIAATKRFWLSELAADLRPLEENLMHPTTENIGHYSDLIAEAGGADVVYSGPGWTGHLAFIEPDVPEWSKDLEEFLTQGARITTLNPLTIAQNSLHASFGASGDIAAVPPKAATIGPLDVARAKRRVETHGITTRGSFVTWQRLVSRLALHGPVTPQVPTSIIQRLGAEVYVSETLAAPVVPDFEIQY
jgi:6-phosphogluconolactonase/glucosamine-6-phosphate isomerase/deaminase